MALRDWLSTPASQQTEHPDACTREHDAAKPNPNPAPSPPKAKQTAYDRDEAALRELQALFDSSTAASKPASHAPPPPTQPTAAAAADDDDITDSMYPTELSCRRCFDAAFYCSSIGGQLTNVYRYGGLRSCSDLWRQWRFCMRARSLPPDERARRVRDWNRAKEVQRRLARNSEDVWALRAAGRGQTAEDAVPALFGARERVAAADARAQGAMRGDALPAPVVQGRTSVIRDGAVGRPVQFGWR